MITQSFCDDLREQLHVTSQPGEKIMVHSEGLGVEDMSNPGLEKSRLKLDLCQPVA